jgi:hypothetical protein
MVRLGRLALSSSIFYGICDNLDNTFILTIL